MDSKIGLFVNSLEGYQGCIVRDVKEAAAAAGIPVDVFDAGHNASQQAQDAVRFANLNAGLRLCAFLIPEADAVSEGRVEDEPIYPLASRLVRKGVGLIVLNHGREALVTQLRADFPEVPTALVAIDNIGFGRVQGQQLRKLLPKGGQALCVRGNPFDSACRDRTRGLCEELAQASHIHIDEIDARWDYDLAEPAVHKWITSAAHRQKALDAIVSQNDQMGEAARKALKRAAQELGRAELAQVPILGGDGLPEFGMRWVAEGVLTSTVVVTLPGRLAVEQIARYWNDGTPIPPASRSAVRSHPPLAELGA